MSVAAMLHKGDVAAKDLKLLCLVSKMWEIVPSAGQGKIKSFHKNRPGQRKGHSLRRTVV